VTPISVPGAAALLLLAAISTAQAAPLPHCSRPPAPFSAIPANTFKNSPAPRAVDPSAERCAWGVGLAILPKSTGTAFIVAHPREIMTNLHVVDPDCDGNARFAFGHAYKNGRSLSTVGATVVARGSYCAERRHRQFDYGGDWAIAVLDSDPGATEPMSVRTGARPLELRAGDLASLVRDNGRYFLVGYGMHFEHGTVPYLSPGCVLDRMFSADVVRHTCSAGHRSSGAPILYADAQGACDMVALHVGSITDAAGTPAYSSQRNANVAVLAARFIGAARIVAKDLNDGKSAGAIVAELRASR